MPKFILAVILLMASICSQVARAEEAPLAACAKWVIDYGSDNAFQSSLAHLLLDLPREVPVRQKAFLESDGTFHVMDVITNNGAANDVLLIVANPDHTRNIFFVTRVDGVLRRTAASSENKAASVIPNTAHPDLFAQEIKFWRNKVPKD
jgi:hypothetical protein